MVSNTRVRNTVMRVVLGAVAASVKLADSVNRLVAGGCCLADSVRKLVAGGRWLADSVIRLVAGRIRPVARVAFPADAARLPVNAFRLR